MTACLLGLPASAAHVYMHSELRPTPDFQHSQLALYNDGLLQYVEEGIMQYIRPPRLAGSSMYYT